MEMQIAEGERSRDCVQVLLFYIIVLCFLFQNTPSWQMKAEIQLFPNNEKIHQEYKYSWSCLSSKYGLWNLDFVVVAYNISMFCVYIPQNIHIAEQSLYLFFSYKSDVFCWVTHQSSFNMWFELVQLCFKFHYDVISVLRNLNVVLWQIFFSHL